MVLVANCVNCFSESVANPEAAVLAEFVLGDLELLFLSEGGITSL